MAGTLSGAASKGQENFRHPQGVRGFDNQNNDERSSEIIRTAIEFIRLHLGGEAPKYAR
jgi:hypothetical protein